MVDCDPSGLRDASTDPRSSWSRFTSSWLSLGIVISVYKQMNMKAPSCAEIKSNIKVEVSN